MTIAFKTGGIGVLHVLRDGAPDGVRDGICRVHHVDCNDSPGKTSDRVPRGSNLRRASFRNRLIFRHEITCNSASTSFALRFALRMDLQSVLADQAWSEQDG